MHLTHRTMFIVCQNWLQPCPNTHSSTYDCHAFSLCCHGGSLPIQNKRRVCAIRQQYGLSTRTLVREAPQSMLKLAKFDGWLRRAGHFDSRPPGYRIQSTLDYLEKKRKRKNDEKEDTDNQRPTKRNCLVIPDTSLKDTIRAAKVRRVS